MGAPCEDEWNATAFCGLIPVHRVWCYKNMHSTANAISDQMLEVHTEVVG